MADNHADDQASNLELESNEPQSLTKDDIVQLVNQIFHNAMSKKTSALEKKFTDLLEQKLSNLIPSETVSDKKEEVGDTKLNNKQRDAELNKLKAEVEAMKQKALEDAKKLNESKLQFSLQEQLTNLNVAPSMMKAAIALLKHDQLVGYDDSGNLLFNPNSEDVLDLSTGLSNWIKSEDAKGFIQPRNIQGSGDKGYKSPSEENSKGMSDEQLLAFITGDAVIPQ